MNNDKLPVSAQVKNSRHSSTSLFDSIKQVREDGSEFWSARDLMPILGYRKWERFADSIERAKIAVQNCGHEPDQHLPGAGKLQNRGNRGATQEVEDYHLTRYGAYMVAMNGDVRKTEIAEAQSYFAVQTYIAETSTPQPITPPSRLELAMMVIEYEKEKLALEATIQEQEPDVRFARALGSSSNNLRMKEYAKTIDIPGIGPNTIFKAMERLKLIYRHQGHWLPYQQYLNAGYFKVDQSPWMHRDEVELTPVIKVTAKGQQWLYELLRKDAEVAA